MLRTPNIDLARYICLFFFYVFWMNANIADIPSHSLSVENLYFCRWRMLCNQIASWFNHCQFFEFMKMSTICPWKWMFSSVVHYVHHVHYQIASYEMGIRTLNEFHLEFFPFLNFYQYRDRCVYHSQSMIPNQQSEIYLKSSVNYPFKCTAPCIGHDKSISALIFEWYYLHLLFGFKSS